MSTSTPSSSEQPVTAGSGSAPAGPDPETVIAAARGAIDALDDRLLGLVRERMALSATVQRTRIAAGGRRVHLSREMAVLHRYRRELGAPGTALAMTLLELCRGRV